MEWVSLEDYYTVLKKCIIKSMSRLLRLINGKGDWEATPPTGASDADLYQIANDIVAREGVLDKDGGDGLVTELDTPVKKVKLAKGTIYVENSSWVKNSFAPRFYQVVADADQEIDVSSNASGLVRTDLVCQKIDKITTPNDDGSNVAPAIMVEGTPGSGAPAVPNDHYAVAQLDLPDGYSAVTNAMITDLRQAIYINPNIVNGGFVIVADAGTMTLNLENGLKDKFFMTVDGNRNIAFSNAPIGQYFSVYVKQGSGGNKAYVFTADILWTENTTPDRATTAGAIDVYVFVKLPTGEFSGVLASANQS